MTNQLLSIGKDESELSQLDRMIYENSELNRPRSFGNHATSNIEAHLGRHLFEFMTQIEWKARPTIFILVDQLDIYTLSISFVI